MWIDFMNVVYIYAKWLHVAFGFGALVVFWIPIVVKKGSPLHNRVGWVYVAFMSGVAVSAWVMVYWRLGIDSNRTEETTAFAWFLAFIAILSAVTAFFGIRSLRMRKLKPHYTWIDVGASTSLLVAGVAISIYGFTIHNLLVSLFPFIGILLGAQQLLYLFFPSKVTTRATVAHLQGMMACSISTLTAFTVFGAPRLLGIENQVLWLWLAPTLLLSPMITYFSRTYKQAGKKASSR